MLSNPDQLAQTFTYGGPSGANDSITAGPDLFGNYYKRTMTFTGNDKTAISAWVKVVAPGAPSIGAITGGNAQISVPFTAPSNNGGAPITGYRAVAYLESDGSEVAHVDGASSPIVITGLTNGVAVHAKVAAKNDIAGYGVFSAISNHVTPSA